jgi:SAM-dependent methyltransferase
MRDINDNPYSPTWFDTFLHTIDPAQTRREAEFLTRQLPLPRHRRVLDICCGPGRHSLELARLGYDVSGFDCNADVINRAKQAAGSAGNFLIHDMCHTREISGDFDAAILLWQSFGQFDEATNLDVLRQIASKLTAGGRFILDIYDRRFFEPRQGTLVHERAGKRITEHKHMGGNRLVVELDYGDGAVGDRFDWQLFSPDELIALARPVGFNCMLCCTEFDETRAPTGERPRVQYVFEKRL